MVTQIGSKPDTGYHGRMPISPTFSRIWTACSAPQNPLGPLSCLLSPVDTQMRQTLSMHMEMVDREEWRYIKSKPTGASYMIPSTRPRDSPTRRRGIFEVVRDAVAFFCHSSNCWLFNDSLLTADDPAHTSKGIFCSQRLDIVFALKTPWRHDRNSKSV